VLAGRTERKGVSGYLLVDGHDQPHNFKCMTGYVVQVDTTHCRSNTILPTSGLLNTKLY